MPAMVALIPLLFPNGGTMYARSITCFSVGFLVWFLFQGTAGAAPIVIDPLRITEAVTFSVGDVGNFNPFGRLPINDPAGLEGLPNDIFRLRQNSGSGRVAVGDLFVGSPLPGNP